MPPMGWLDLLFMGLTIACAIAALAAPSLVAAVVLFGAFSFFSALFFASHAALDVAFTEAAVGAGITGVFFLAGLFRDETGPGKTGEGS